MWPFKKKVMTKKDKPLKKKKNIKLIVSPEDRFTVMINKDNNNYQIVIIDTWSKILFKENLTKGTNWVKRHDITMTNIKNEKKVLKVIEKGKDELRKSFDEERNEQCKSEKIKEEKL